MKSNSSTVIYCVPVKIAHVSVLGEVHNTWPWDFAFNFRVNQEGDRIGARCLSERNPTWCNCWKPLDRVTRDELQTTKKGLTSGRFIRGFLIYAGRISVHP